MMSRKTTPTCIPVCLPLSGRFAGRNAVGKPGGATTRERGRAGSLWRSASLAAAFAVGLYGWSHQTANTYAAGPLVIAKMQEGEGSGAGPVKSSTKSSAKKVAKTTSKESKQTSAETAVSGDESKVAEGKSAESKKRGPRLPRYFSKLGLADDQRSQVLALQEQFDVQESQLREQLELLAQQREQELSELLTDEQRAQLQSLIEARTAAKKPESGMDESSIELK